MNSSRSIQSRIIDDHHATKAGSRHLNGKRIADTRQPYLKEAAHPPCKYIRADVEYTNCTHRHQRISLQESAYTASGARTLGNAVTYKILNAAASHPEYLALTRPCRPIEFDSKG